MFSHKKKFKSIFIFLRYKSLTRTEQDKILACLFCEKPFNYINSYVIHLVSELQCYRQFVHAAQAKGTPDLGK